MKYICFKVDLQISSLYLLPYLSSTPMGRVMDKSETKGGPKSSLCHLMCISVSFLLKFISLLIHLKASVS